MASLPSSLSSSMLLFLALTLILTFVWPACSTTRQALLDPKTTQTGFKITLKHVDSGGNFTKFERLQRAMERGRHRLQRLNARVLAATDVKAPVYHGISEFLMNLSIGTPPESYSAIMDTGSDLIWTQCMPCPKCFDQPTPVFDPAKSSSFSKLTCSSNLCAAPLTPNCSTDSCEYLYPYVDNSYTQGAMATETFTFGEVSVSNILFGCGENNEGSVFSQAAGLVGLGRGSLSLVSQLGVSKFSYCLTSIDDPSKTSSLLMGSLTSVNGIGGGSPAITTSLVWNPKRPSFYYISLEGITVGDTALPIDKSTFAINDDGSGGLIIDSGTTFTYLEQSVFDLVKNEFISQTKLSVNQSGSASTKLDLCFTLPSDGSAVEVPPKLVFHFDGGDLDLPSENYMVSDSSVGLICLTMKGSSGMSIFGNVQQQNMMVVHDLTMETISFIPTQCDQL